jgi:hypothetical protein
VGTSGLEPYAPFVVLAGGLSSCVLQVQQWYIQLPKAFAGGGSEGGGGCMDGG